MLVTRMRVSLIVADDSIFVMKRCGLDIDNLQIRRPPLAIIIMMFSYFGITRAIVQALAPDNSAIIPLACDRAMSVHLSP